MRWTVWGALALGAWVSACDADDDRTEVPIEEAADRIVDAFCKRHFGCNCDYTHYDSDLECSSAATGWVERLRTQGESHGLEYRPGCIGGWLDRIAEAGCRPPAEEEQQTCVRPCAPYVGDRDRGEPCEFLGDGVSQCAAGLVCSGGSCEDPCEGWTPDVRVGAGGSCAERTCADDLVCDGTRTCVAPELTADGEPCTGHGECRSGYCPAAFCAPMPKLGESCRGAGVCAEGLDCHDDICEPAEAEVCGLFIPPDDL
jgi:hypothetical protein